MHTPIVAAALAAFVAMAPSENTPDKEAPATKLPEPIVFCCKKVGVGWGNDCKSDTFATRQDARTTCGDMALLACSDQGYAEDHGNVTCSWIRN